MKKKLIALAAALCLLLVMAAAVHGQLADETLAVSIDSATSESTMTTDVAAEEAAAVVEEPVEVSEAAVEEAPAVVSETVEEAPVVVEEAPAVVEETPAEVSEPAAVSETVEETPAVVEETPAEVSEPAAVSETVEETPAEPTTTETTPEVTEPTEGEEVTTETTPEVTEPTEGEETTTETTPEVTEPTEGEEVTPEVTDPTEGEEVTPEPTTPEVTDPTEGEETTPTEGEEPTTPEETESPEITIISPLSAAMSANSAATAGDVISGTVSVSGGVAPYQVTLTVTLDGVMMDGTGAELTESGEYTISYQTAQAGAYTISAAVADAAGTTATADAQVTVAEAYIDYKNNAKWQALADEVALTGDWRTDVLLIAQSQLYYTENTTDVEVNGDQVNGYTLYGEWAGNAYADWCAAFLGWCFEQADTGMDFRMAAVSEWVDKAEAYSAFKGAEYTPEAGDIIFIIPNDQQTIGHIGIVEYVNGEMIGTIEANVANMVDRRTYQLGEAAIGGYMSMTALMDAMNVEYAGSAAAFDVQDVEDFTAYLNTDEEVNVRFGPSTDTNRAATLSGVGTPVTVTAQVEADGTLWYLIICEDAYGTQTGYMMAKFLDGSAPVAEEEAEQIELTVEEDEAAEEPVVEEEPVEIPAEIAEWAEANAVSDEMLERAMNATSLESLVIEGEKVIYVRTGDQLATYNEADNTITDIGTGLVLGTVDMETGVVTPVTLD